MPVRKTESNIPRGYTAEDLGQVGEITDSASELPSGPDCYLISYLTSLMTVVFHKVVPPWAFHKVVPPEP
jgi:hypothetical protein